MPTSILARRDVLGDAVAASGTYNGLKAHLYQNDITPSPVTVLADLEEADFDGYAASAVVTWGAAFSNILNQGVIVAAAVYQFTATGGTTPNVIYGFYLTQDPPVSLVYSERLPAPVPVNGVGDAITIVPSILQPEAP